MPLPSPREKEPTPSPPEGGSWLETEDQAGSSEQLPTVGGCGEGHSAGGNEKRPDDVAQATARKGSPHPPPSLPARKGKAAQTGKWSASDDRLTGTASPEQEVVNPSHPWPTRPAGAHTWRDSWPESPCSLSALGATLFLETPLQPGPPFCGWGV